MKPANRTKLMTEYTTSLFRTNEEYHIRCDEFRAYIIEQVNPERVKAGLGEIRDAEARECFRILDQFFVKWRQPVNGD